MKPAFEFPIACLITTGEATTENFPQKRIEILKIIVAAVRNRIGMVQVREKQLPARLMFELVSGAVKIARDSATSILVNDRADVAVAAGADGVHLPADSLSVDLVREKFPLSIIGVSTHSLEAAQEAAGKGADYAFFGPVFDTPGKGRARGPEVFAEICGRLKPFPVIALGGIDAANYEKVLACGGGGIAAIRFLNDPKNLETVSDRLAKGRF